MTICGKLNASAEEGRGAMAQESPEEARWRITFRALLKEAPQDYSRRYHQFGMLRETFYGELARLLAPALREYLRTQPQDTVDAKTTLATRLNEELRNIGLAILCPRTGRPATLAVYSGKDDATGRGYFGLEVQDHVGNSVQTTPKMRSIPLLDHLMLTQNDSSIAAPLATRMRRNSKSPRGR
jgi:hypothetical protein